MLYKKSARVSAAVAANAGTWTTYPLERDDVTLRAALVRPLHIVLGEMDDDPNDAKLTKTSKAASKGRNRLERGKLYFELAKKDAKRLGVKLAWTVTTVPGVGHNPSPPLVSKSAALLLPP